MMSQVVRCVLAVDHLAEPGSLHRMKAMGAILRESLIESDRHMITAPNADDIRRVEICMTPTTPHCLQGRAIFETFITEIIDHRHVNTGGLRIDTTTITPLGAPRPHIGGTTIHEMTGGPHLTHRGTGTIGEPHRGNITVGDRRRDTGL